MPENPSEQQPGPSRPCPSPEKNAEDPSCARTLHFLSFYDLNIDHEYHICPKCMQIWEGQKFYQDYFMTWEPISWEEFRRMSGIWVGKENENKRPDCLNSASISSFLAWVNALEVPVEVKEF